MEFHGRQQCPNREASNGKRRDDYANQSVLGDGEWPAPPRIRMSRLPPHSHSRPTLLVLGPLFVALSGLAFLFPLSGDDWSWGSSDGIGRLRDSFAGYNGRYLGNLSVLVLTRTIG